MALFKRSILFPATLLALTLGAWAEEPPATDAGPVIPEHVPVSEATNTAPTPEPTATLLAGLGGLALLFFAMRRK